MKKYSVLLATVSMVAISFVAQANEAALRQRQQEAAREKSRAQAAAAASHGNTELSNTRTSHETSGRERHGSGSAHGRAEIQISEDPEKNTRDGVPVPENTITPAGNTVTPAGNTGSAAGGGLRRENIGGTHVNPGGGTDGLPPRP